MFLELFYFRKRTDFEENNSQIRFGETYPEYLYQQKYWNYQPLMASKNKAIFYCRVFYFFCI